MSGTDAIPIDLSGSFSSESLQPASSSAESLNPSSNSNDMPTDSHSHQPQHHHSNSSNKNTLMQLYTPPTPLTILRSAAINLILPFINGLMLGFGELFAHEIAFRLGWSGTRIFPSSRTSSGLASARAVGPGIEMREDPSERDRRELADLTSLE